MKEQLLSTEIWEKHENLVRWTVWKVIKRYGGDFEEGFSEALVLYTEAVQSYEPKLGSLGYWITFRVFKGLQEIKRTEARHLRITGSVGGIEQDVQEPSSFLSELWKSLSIDSQHVLNCLFDLDSDQFKNKSLAKLQLRQVLKKRGLAKDQITGCFREIEAALV